LVTELNILLFGDTIMNKATHNTDTNAEQTYSYNILAPDFAIFVVGITCGFATLLALFS